MTLQYVAVLKCDKTGCREEVRAQPGEDTPAVRRRANRELGWRSTPSFAHGGHTDLCRWHG